MLLVPFECGFSAVVEVTEANFNPVLLVRASWLTASPTAAAAKEAAEQIERVVVSAATSAIAMRLYSIVAVSIVDLSQLGIAQDFVGFRDLDELIVGSVIATIDVTG
jgi:hypothetical protein